MKKYMIIIGVILLSACGNNESSDNVNIEEDNKDSNTVLESDEMNNSTSINDVDEGYWVNYQGELEESNNYVTSQFIDFDSENSYIVSHNSYVSYFDSEDNHLQTIRYSGKDELQAIDGANKIRVSFTKDRLGNFKLETN